MEDTIAQKSGEFFEYSKAAGRLAMLVTNSKDAQLAAISSRKMRKALVSVDALRQQGKLRAGETYISVKLIDGNIKQDMPQFVGYLKQGSRLGVFEFTNPADRSDTIGQALLETEFTRCLTYTDWEETYLKWAQGARLHGYDFVEIVEDLTMPGQVAVNHVGMDCLLFDSRCENIQASPALLRAFRVTSVLLKEYSDIYGFNPQTVETVAKKLSPVTSSVSVSDYTTDSTDIIYRVYFKDNGKVFDAWYVQGATTWLREPRPFFNGRKALVTPPPSDDYSLEPEPPVLQPVQETEYPFEILYKDITEEKAIQNHTGRGQDDLYKQDAASTLQTALVNSCTRASKVMWSPKTPNMDRGGSAPKIASMPLKDGVIWDQAMEAHNAPWPDPMLFKSIEHLATSNAAENNQFAAAVSNRKDTRKTAEELKVAQQLNAAVSGVEVLTFSMAMRRVLNRCWEIIKSKATNNEIPFCQDQGQNNVILINKPLTIKPAGDIDYVERQQRVGLLQQDMPQLMQTVPLLAMAMLQDYISLVYPDRAQLYTSLIAKQQEQNNQVNGLKQLLGNTANVLKEVVTDEHGQLKPDLQNHAQDFAAIQQQIQQALQ